MPFLQSTSLEFGAWPVERLIAIVFAAVRTTETIRVGKYFVNVLCIIGPISCNMESAPSGQPGGDQFNKLRLYDATFMMAFLGPRIRKIKIDARERCFRNLLFQHLNCVVNYQAHIHYSGVVCFEEAMPYTWIMYFDSQKIPVSVLRRLFNKCLAVAETDFQHDRLPCLKDGVKLRRTGSKLQAVNRPQLGKCLFLRRRQAAGTAYETADSLFVLVWH